VVLVVVELGLLPQIQQPEHKILEVAEVVLDTRMIQQSKVVQPEVLESL
jgi:hypothetical protein